MFLYCGKLRINEMYNRIIMIKEIKKLIIQKLHLSNSLFLEIY